MYGTISRPFRAHGIVWVLQKKEPLAPKLIGTILNWKMYVNEMHYKFHMILEIMLIFFGLKNQIRNSLSFKCLWRSTLTLHGV